MMKHYLTRRNQCMCVAAWMMVGCLPVVVAKADEPKPALKQSAAVAEAVALYTVSYSRLERGRAYNLAIADLQQAIKLVPEKSQYHVALGCAQAGRAMVIADAAYTTTLQPDDSKRYTKLLKEWTDAQQNNASPLFGTPRPTAPVVVTQDDQQPYRLNREEATHKYHELLIAAFVAWDQSVALARTPTERSAALYTRGWGRLLFARAWVVLNNFEKKEPLAAEAKLLDKEQAIDDFTTLTTLFPKEARNWQALGDSYCEERHLDENKATCELAMKAYRQALERKKANTALWYRVYTLSKNRNPVLTEQALGEMVAQEPGNAFASYRLAILLMAKTSYAEFHQIMVKAVEDYSKRFDAEAKAGTITKEDVKEPLERRRMFERETESEITQRLLSSGRLAKDEPIIQAAMDKIEEGNRAAVFVTPSYMPPVAPLLAPAWRLHSDMYDEDLTSSLTLSMITTGEGFANVAARQGRMSQAARMLLDILHYSNRLTGGLDIQRLPVGGSEGIMIIEGCRYSDLIYHDLIQFYKDAGDSAGADRMQSEMLAFEERWRRYDAERRRQQQHTYGFD